jgi:ketosteroid isomerase-like protein
MSATDYERTIRAYFDACTAGDATAIAAFFAPDAVHYFPDGDTFPDGSLQRAFRGAEAIGHGFGDRFGGEFGTRWTVDHVLVDAGRREAVIEWSNFKPSVAADARLRGCEFYRFDADGRILEIRAYYACPPGAPGRVYELGEFDYVGRGYPLADASGR